MLGSLRMLGFVPADLSESVELRAFVAEQLRPKEEFDVVERHHVAGAELQH